MRGDATPPAWPFTLNRASPQARGLLLWLPMDPPAGQTVFDQAGRHRDAASTGGVGWAPGPFGGLCFQGDGSARYLTVASDSAFDLTGYLTVACWLKIPSTSSRLPVTKYPADTGVEGGWALDCNGFTAGEVEFFVISPPGTEYVNKGVAFTTGEWFHAAGVFNQDETGTDKVRLYRNGREPSATLTNAGTVTALSVNSEPVRLGTTGALAPFFDGRVWDLRIYDRALTAADVWDLYAPPSRFDLWDDGADEVAAPAPAATGWGPLLGGRRNRLVRAG